MSGYCYPQQTYSNYPEYQKSFYKNGYQQEHQLNLNRMMPAEWNSVSAAQAASSCYNANDWSRYAVTPDGVARYVSTSGALRFQSIDRSSEGRIIGQPNLLRSRPNTALQMYDQPWFNRSSFSEPLVMPEVQRYIGCG